MKPRTKQETLEHLLRKATRNENGCLICHIKPNAKGYSNLTYGRAHRFVWETVKGPIPDGIKVCHECDVRNCIEIEHLFLGTSLDNSQDMVTKNRVARLGRPAIDMAILEETYELKLCGFSLRQIAEEQGLSSPSAAADRLRRFYAARNAQSV